MTILSNYYKRYLALLTLITLSFSSISYTNPIETGESFIVCYPTWIAGQLGNQLFPVAAALSLGIDYDAKVYFPFLTERIRANVPTNREMVFWRLDSSYPPVDPLYSVKKIDRNDRPVLYIQKGVNPKYKKYPVNTSRFKGLKKTYYLSKFTSKKPFKNGVLLDIPAWSEKYFAHNKDKIIKLLGPSQEIYDDLYSRYAEIIDHPCSVAIHVRALRNLHKTNYINLAIKKFPKDALFIVCSDNIEKCKQELKGLRNNMVFIEQEPTTMIFIS